MADEEKKPKSPNKHPKDKNFVKEGVSVEEIEKFSKKYRLELAFLVYFVLATFFTFLFWGSTLSIYLAGLGGVLGIWLPEKVASISKSVFSFVFKQEKTTQIILAVVGIILAIFVAPLIFFTLGLMGGMSIFYKGYKGIS